MHEKDGDGSNILAMLLVALTVLWLLDAPPWETERIGAYSASCANGVKILPLTEIYERTNSIERAIEQLRENKSRCEILTGGRTFYRLNPARGEVYYRNSNIPQPPGKLVDCRIFNRADWVCEYSDGSGKVAFIDGMPALYRGDSLYGVFYMTRASWHLANFLTMMGWYPLQASWLIPDQKAVY